MIPKYPMPTSGVGAQRGRQVDHVDHRQGDQRQRADRARDHIRTLVRLRWAKTSKH